MAKKDTVAGFLLAGTGEKMNKTDSNYLVVDKGGLIRDEPAGNRGHFQPVYRIWVY